jgi:hypothetical protein
MEAIAKLPAHLRLGPAGHAPVNIVNLSSRKTTAVPQRDKRPHLHKGLDQPSHFPQGPSPVTDLVLLAKRELGHRLSMLGNDE